MDYRFKSTNATVNKYVAVRYDQCRTSLMTPDRHEKTRVWTYSTNNNIATTGPFTRPYFPNRETNPLIPTIAWVLSVK